MSKKKIKKREIKDCPFCGNKEPIIDTGSTPYGHQSFVECCGLNCAAIMFGKDEDDALQKWNRRIHGKTS